MEINWGKLPQYPFVAKLNWNLKCNSFNSRTDSKFKYIECFIFLKIKSGFI